MLLFLSECCCKMCWKVGCQSCVLIGCFCMVTGRKMIAWTGCTRAQVVRCPGMSTCWDVPLTRRSLISMRSPRVVHPPKLASCLGPSLTPPPPPPTLTWLPRLGKTPCLKSGQAYVSGILLYHGYVILTFGNKFPRMQG